MDLTGRLLDAWERGTPRSVTARALVLLSVGEESEATDGDLAALSIGRRDARLFDLRARLFGDRVVALATCGVCGESLELDFYGSDVTSGPPEPRAPSADLHAHGHDLRVRLLDSRDLDAVSSLSDIGSARKALLRRSVLDARRAGMPVPPEELPVEVLDTVDAWLADSDPQADVQVELVCPGCAAAWRQGFDIVTFLWAEVDAWARRTLHEVHRLATAYGWREDDVLALSAARRQAYLDLVGT